MKDLIRQILREEVSRKFTKGSSNSQSLIIKHMEKAKKDLLFGLVMKTIILKMKLNMCLIKNQITMDPKLKLC